MSTETYRCIPFDCAPEANVALIYKMAMKKS